MWQYEYLEDDLDNDVLLAELADFLDKEGEENDCIKELGFVFFVMEAEEEEEGCVDVNSFGSVKVGTVVLFLLLLFIEGGEDRGREDVFVKLILLK